MRTVGEFSEEEILERILPLFAQTASASGVPVPAGDDAAVLGTLTAPVVTTDSMVRGRDWRDDWSRAAEVGAKVVTQNIADVAAMGARGVGLLVALACGQDTPMEWVLELAAGIAEAASEAQIPVVGGDLSSAPEGVIIIGVTALGDLEGRAPVVRSGARVGDVVAVCGSLGWSGAGLFLYAAGAGEPKAPGGAVADVDPEAQIRQARELVMAYHRTPATPYRGGVGAAEAGARSMIDISDGLVTDAARVARASGVELALDEAVLRAEFLAGTLTDAVGEEEGWRQVLSGGEEHSLLATFANGEVPMTQPPWRVIGEVRDAGESGPRVTVGGVVPTLTGWDHFAG